jgi:hypothetical protein
MATGVAGAAAHGASSGQRRVPDRERTARAAGQRLATVTSRCARPSSRLDVRSCGAWHEPAIPRGAGECVSVLGAQQPRALLDLEPALLDLGEPTRDRVAREV